MRIIKIPCFLCLFVILQSCLWNNTPGYFKNAQINSGKRADFRELNQQAFTYIKAGDVNQLGSMLSKELLENHETNRLVEVIGNGLKTDDYNLLDEYYVINKRRSMDTVENPSKNINSYKLIYSPVSEEMYIAFFTPKSGLSRSIITLVYGKYDYGWKLANMDMGIYTLNGKTAPQLFELAQQQYNKNYLIDASNTMEMAKYAARPTDMWHYEDDSDMGRFYAKVSDEVHRQYHFPIAVKQVPSHPRIFKVFDKTLDDGNTYPMIYYQSGIKLADTVALKKENDQLRKVIGTIFPGIDKDKKHLLYTAFNQLPNPQTTVDRYSVDDKLQ